jgi:hypothetical protein
MSNVVRLVNGGTIQVRTGVLQGIGPMGPRGLRGVQGNDGAQGPVGEPGPIGQILQLQGRTTVGSNTVVAANTDVLLAFGAVAYDDLSCFASSTNVVINNAGDYMLSCWVRYDDAAAGYRDLWFLAGGSTTIARKSTQITAGAACYSDLTHPWRSAGGGEIITVRVRSSAATGISLGALTVTRVGAGPAGPQGPTGPQGAQGLQGAQGIQGVPGSASSGFATYAGLKAP